MVGATDQWEGAMAIREQAFEISGGTITEYRVSLQVTFVPE
jgi:hypothetical protein